MIRVGLLTEDKSMQVLLTTAMGREFRIFREPIAQGIDPRISASDYDVLLLDLQAAWEPMILNDGGAEKLFSLGTPVVVMADPASRATADELVRGGAFGATRRPPSIRELKTMLGEAAASWKADVEIEPKREIVSANDQCDSLLGSSAAMQTIYSMVSRVTNINASVLITGASGSGKELIARAIHNLGSRADKPFVAVSCSAIPETLIEAELFGHEKGAFTGTTGMREGYFEQAQDGTLFLDEIGDLSPLTQVKLLRVLQEMEFNRLGSNRLIPLRARLIFATHQDLAKLVDEGKFRQDLYFRINVIRIASPTLTERAEDIPQLATHFLRHYSTLFGKPMDHIEPEAMAVLRSYPWPGNVRELENIIQRAIVMASGATLTAKELPIAVNTDKVIDIGEYSPDSTFERQLRDYKVRLALDAVREHNGNKTLAARSLGISRAYLHRLIRPDEQDEMGSVNQL
ncbi:MAG TPA: sigma-54 dependent transcriptional regulator [Terracidiphilus sp.]